MENVELQHHGIKGMRWGVRRSKAMLDRLSGRSSRGDDDSSESGGSKKSESSKPKQKSVKDMSDEELNAAINRLQLEKRYMDLMRDTSPQPPKQNNQNNQQHQQNQKKEKTIVKKGAEFVGDVLATSGKNLAVQAINYYGAKKLNEMINEKETVKKIKPEEMDDYEVKLKEVIFTNNKKK